MCVCVCSHEVETRACNVKRRGHAYATTTIVFARLALAQLRPHNPGGRLQNPSSNSIRSSLSQFCAMLQGLRKDVHDVVTPRLASAAGIQGGAMCSAPPCPFFDADAACPTRWCRGGNTVPRPPRPRPHCRKPLDASPQPQTCGLRPKACPAASARVGTALAKLLALLPTRARPLDAATPRQNRRCKAACTASPWCNAARRPKPPPMPTCTTPPTNSHTAYQPIFRAGPWRSAMRQEHCQQNKMQAASAPQG